MEIQDYFIKKKELYDLLFQFIDIENDDGQKEQAFLKFLTKEQNYEFKEELKQLIQLLVSISNNHKRCSNLFDKIKKILMYISNKMKQVFTNIEIFDLFKTNKIQLLFLITKKIISVDESLVQHLLQIDEEVPKFSYYFYPEIKFLLNEEKMKSIETELLSYDPNILNDFDKKRQQGENDSYICSLIRNDSIEDFITYINKNCISPSSKINQSIFETNPFLIENEPTLIEYASFYGSKQIIQYLKMNRVELSSSLWLYSIHSQEAELIHFLEENFVTPNDETYKECFKESIKCHHNDIANYIKDNLLKKDNENNCIFDNIESFGFEFHNYSYLPQNAEDKMNFYFACMFDYLEIVKFFVRNKLVNINEMIIIKLLFCYIV